MRNAIGNDKFAALLEVIDRAPGGRDKALVQQVIFYSNSFLF